MNYTVTEPVRQHEITACVVIPPRPNGLWTKGHPDIQWCR